MNAVSIDETTDWETTRTILLVVLDCITPDHRQVVNDPVLLIVEQDSLLQETHLFDAALSRVESFSANLDALLVF